MYSSIPASAAWNAASRLTACVLRLCSDWTTWTTVTETAPRTVVRAIASTRAMPRSSRSRRDRWRSAWSWLQSHGGGRLVGERPALGGARADDDLHVDL